MILQVIQCCNKRYTSWLTTWKPYCMIFIRTKLLSNILATTNTRVQICMWTCGEKINDACTSTLLLENRVVYRVQTAFPYTINFACRHCLTIAATTCRWRLPLSQLNIKKYTQFHITVLSAKETSANLWAILGVYDHLCSCTTHKQVENDADCCSPTMWWHYSLTLTPQIMTKHLTSCHSAYKW